MVAVGLKRPPLNSFLFTGAAVLICPQCKRDLTTLESIGEHWAEGHFDYMEHTVIFFIGIFYVIFILVSLVRITLAYLRTKDNK